MGRARLFAPLEFSEWFLTPPDFVGRSGGLPAFDEPAAAASSAPNVRADPLSRPAACRQMRIREAAPGSGWSLAGPHRIPQRQGVHFFPFGCLFDSGTLPTDRYLDDVRDAGFNGVLIEPGSMEGSVTNMLRAAQARHLWVNALVPDDPDSVPPGPQVWPASTLAWFSAEWEEGADPHWVPPQEQRCRAYLALIRGVRGIMYTGYPFVLQSTWDTLRILGAEMVELAPLMEKPPPPFLWVHVPGTDGQSVNMAVTLRGTAGRYTLLCANPSPHAVRAVWEVSLLGEKERIQKRFTQAMLMSTNRVFTDRLEAFAVRAYDFSGQNLTGPCPPLISLAASFMGEDDVQASAPSAPATSPDNRVANAGFEKEAQPGFPAGYYAVHRPGLQPGERVGAATPAFTLDPIDPWRGNASLQIVAAQDEERGVGQGVEAPAVTQTWLWRLHARASCADTALVLSAGGLTHDVLVGTEWVTYEWRFDKPVQVTRIHAEIRVLNPSLSPVTLWTDEWFLAPMAPTAP